MNKKFLTGISIAALAIPMFAFALEVGATGGVGVATEGRTDVVVAAHASSTLKRKTVDPMCISAAIEKRDSAVISGFSAFSTSVSAALTARKDALKAAVVMTDKTAKESARKKAWAAFKASSKTAHTSLVSARRSAWAAYSVDTKACGQMNTEAAATVGTSGLSL